METVLFKSKAANKLYTSYLNRVISSSKVLSEEDKTEILMEIKSHIYEGLNKVEGENETDKLINILDKLGEPEVFLKPMIADRKMAQATKTFNPKDIFTALRLNIQNGIKYSVFVLLYLSLSIFGFLIIFKIIWPDQTGLFYNDQLFSGFGFVNNTEGLTEVLGYWLILISIAAGAFCFALITLLLKISRH